MDYLKVIEEAINPPVTLEEVKGVTAQLKECRQGERIYFTFRGERMSVECGYSAQETAIDIMEKIGFKHPTNGKHPNV